MGVQSKRVQRLYERVVSNRKNCSFDDLENLLLALGFHERKTSGSHVIFKRDRITISIPKRKAVKENYVEQVIAIIAEIATGDE